MSVEKTTQAKATNAQPSTRGLLQRTCACGNHAAGGECESCQKKSQGILQRAAVNNSPVDEVPSIVHEVLESSGQPLDHATRAYMEPRFRQDFSQVRVHTDTKASESARAVRAQAYTVGQDIVFGSGQYTPDNLRGKFLIAHELTHVVQQAGANTAQELKNVRGKNTEREANAAAYTVAYGGKAAVSQQMQETAVQKIDFTPASLETNDIDPRVALVSDDYVDNNISDVALRQGPSSFLSVNFVAYTIKYNDGSMVDIPTTSTFFKPPRRPGEVQIIRYRRHPASGKILPVTWRGRPEDLPETDGGPFGQVIFASDITPNIDLGCTNAVARRAFAFAGEMAQIWGVVLAARGALQLFSAVQMMAIQAAGRAALATGAGISAAQRLAVREAQRQALEAERRAIIAELRTAGIRFTESRIIHIGRTVAGRIVWLERGNAAAGLEHIMARHGSQFAQLGVRGEEAVSRLIFETVTTKTPIRILARGEQVFRTIFGSVEREIRIIVSENGFIVSAFPL